MMSQAVNQFDWVEFYKEFAEKLLAYKDNRQELIIKVKEKLIIMLIILLLQQLQQQLILMDHLKNHQVLINNKMMV